MRHPCTVHSVADGAASNLADVMLTLLLCHQHGEIILDDKTKGLNGTKSTEGGVGALVYGPGGGIQG